jgi:hypothetical protein
LEPASRDPVQRSDFTEEETIMNVVTKGAIIGGAASAVSGDDSIVEGAAKGAAAGGIVKVAVPLVVTVVVAYTVYRLISGRSGRGDTANA